MTKYIYKLGHVSKLSLSEFQEISKGAILEHDQDWLSSEFDLDVNKTGSLVFQFEIIKELASKDFSELEIASEEITKKVAVFSNFSLNRTRLLQKFKDLGFKKINLLSDKLPNYGNYRNTKNWLGLLEFKNKVYFGKIKTYYDQEFWSKLDESLPASDMKRGLINIKLARSLNNLVSNSKIWDPFGGLGRNVIAGLDLKNSFVTSDLDPECKIGLEQNISFANNFFQQRGLPIASFQGFWKQDAKDLHNLASKINLQDFSIATEGYLGHNFEAKPNKQQVDKQFEIQRKLWTSTIQSMSRAGIKEAVFCLPAYNLQTKIEPDFIWEVIKDSQYKIKPFYTGNRIIYSRQHSRVCHYIVRIELYSNPDQL